MGFSWASGDDDLMVMMVIRGSAGDASWVSMHAYKAYSLLLFNHTVFTLIRVWQDLDNPLRLRASRLDGGAPPRYPSSPLQGILWMPYIRSQKFPRSLEYTSFFSIHYFNINCWMYGGRGERMVYGIVIYGSSDSVMSKGIGGTPAIYRLYTCSTGSLYKQH
jgi:hypothetical protein